MKHLSWYPYAPAPEGSTVLCLWEGVNGSAVKTGFFVLHFKVSGKVAMCDCREQRALAYPNVEQAKIAAMRKYRASELSKKSPVQVLTPA